jgi:hypothetical protein
MTRSRSSNSSVKVEEHLSGELGFPLADRLGAPLFKPAIPDVDAEGRGLFLFTDIPTLTAYKDRILDLPWRSGGGETVQILSH